MNLAGKTILVTGAAGVGHACEFETSLMLRIAAKLVDTAALSRGKISRRLAGPCPTCCVDQDRVLQNVSADDLE